MKESLKGFADVGKGLLLCKKFPFQSDAKRCVKTAQKLVAYGFAPL